MSGTSLDGLDLCLACFREDAGRFDYLIEKAETYPYPAEWLGRLKFAEVSDGAELVRLHAAYGKYLGQQVNRFLADVAAEKKPELVASHGHTIFHRPDLGYTFQLGSGVALAAECGITVICDFRSGDVALGGQGAPLVPAGDKLLFGEYTYCLNLGGFANISFDADGKRLAFDICPVNYVLNRLAQREGKNYDENGALSAKGKLIPELLEQLNALPYYKKPLPKSLGREWVEETIFPLLAENYSTNDLLRTFTAHAVQQIAASSAGEGKMLVTGGGAHNTFFIDQLKANCKATLVIPGRQAIDFKEALVFAFLGLLRREGRVNILSSVTGAKRDSCGGTICF